MNSQGGVDQDKASGPKGFSDEICSTKTSLSV